jgi:hypothetical protein
LLKIVQDQKQRLATEKANEVVLWRLRTGTLAAASGQDRGDHGCSIANRCQWNKEHAIAIVRLQLRRYRQRQACLADAWRTDQRQQAPLMAR